MALAEEERTSDAIYRYAAARVVELVPPAHQLVEVAGRPMGMGGRLGR